MVAVAQRSRRQVVALKIEGSIPSSHPKKIQNNQVPKINNQINSKHRAPIVKKIRNTNI